MISVYFIASGFLLGLVSSLHCIGMCGPLALALPGGNSKLQTALVYNSGRIVTYALLGLIFGLTGRMFFESRFQQVFSISLGVLMLVLLLQQLFFRQQFAKVTFASGMYKKLQSVIYSLLQQKSSGAFFLLGAANGLLPCSMVYMAITGAMASGSVEAGMLFMVFFGIGTTPAMFTLSYFGYAISLTARNRIRKLFPVMLSLIAILLIIRGLNLNIPFLSPYMYHNAAHAVGCE